MNEYLLSPLCQGIHSMEAAPGDKQTSALCPFLDLGIVSGQGLQLHGPSSHCIRARSTEWVLRKCLLH